MKRRLAKLAALLTALVLLPVCALPETANTPEDQTNIIIEKKTFPHLWCYNKKDGGKVSEGEMNLYFMDGGDIPYVALSEYMDFLSRLYSEVKKADIAYEIGVDAVDEFNRYFIVTRPDNKSAMIVNPGGRHDHLYQLQCIQPEARQQIPSVLPDFADFLLVRQPGACHIQTGGKRYADRSAHRRRLQRGAARHQRVRHTVPDFRQLTDCHRQERGLLQR